MTTKKRKDRKGKKKGKKGAAKRGLPSAVQGLLQYLGGSAASLQASSAPQRPRATGTDAGETLTRYLAAKTQNLEAMRAAAIGATSAAQVEERFLAKRAADDLEKKVGMLSVGLKKEDVGRQRVIRQLTEQERVLRNLVRDQMFEEMRNAPPIDPSAYEGMRTPSLSVGSRNTPYSAGMHGMFEGDSDYSFASSASREASPQRQEGMRSAGVRSGYAEGGGGPAQELYMMNRPLERPIIRDRAPRTPAVRPARAVAGGGGGMPKVTKVNISAADLRAGISAATGLARSRYKLPPSRARYAEVQAALGSTAGSSADLIGALKAAGITGLAEV